MTDATQPPAVRASFDRPRAAAAVASLLAALALALGAALRLHALLDDAPAWDEWHALRAAKDEGLEALATTFGAADRSIPFALYFEALTRTVGLDELGLRAPSALAGLATLTLVPWLWRRRLGAPAAAVLALAFAVSPALVLFSRLARPYAPALLGALLALAAWREWSERGARVHLAGYVAAGALTLWALPVYAPFVLAPPALELVLGARRGAAQATRRAAAALAGAVAAAASLLGPALAHSGDRLLSKAADAELAAGALLDATRILAGAGHAVPGLAIAAAVTALALPGAAREPWRRALLVAALAQAGAVLLVRPRGIQTGFVLARYLLPAAAAFALLACARLRGAPPRRRAAPAAALAALALLALAAAGPLRGWLATGPDGFASTRLYRRIAAPASPEARGSVALPAAYEPIAAAPSGSGAVLEIPYFVSVPPHLGDAQRHHRREVYFGVTAGYCARAHTIELPPRGTGGFELARFVDPGDLDGLRALGIRWAVFHPDGEVRLRGLPPAQVFYEFERCVAEFARRTGRTPARDGGLAVFDLGAP